MNVTMKAIPGMKAGAVYSKVGERAVLRVLEIGGNSAKVERTYPNRHDRRAILRKAKTPTIW